MDSTTAQIQSIDEDKRTFAHNWYRNRADVADALLMYSLTNLGVDLKNIPPLNVKAKEEDEALHQMICIGDTPVMHVVNDNFNVYIRPRKPPQDDRRTREGKSSYLSRAI